MEDMILTLPYLKSSISYPFTSGKIIEIPGYFQGPYPLVLAAFLFLKFYDPIIPSRLQFSRHTPCYLTQLCFCKLLTLAQISLPTFFFKKIYLKSHQLTYSVILVSDVQYIVSAPPYNTQCSSQQVHALIPITYLTDSPTHLSPGIHQFVLYS